MRRLEEALPKLRRAAAAAQQEAQFAVLASPSAGGTAPFDAALRRYVDVLTADGALEVDVEIDHGTVLAPDEQIEVFRIVQEGPHRAQARSRPAAHVWIGQRLGRRIVGVRDDGVGFDGSAGSGGRPKNSSRAETIDGGFALRSQPGGRTSSRVVPRA